ncbi:hypothetical protein SAY86_000895 [Trapa natans]|uniref:Uncharacterized protein n=1 Tax=Trapa natans TaxID=22666 RepID=A0AAN7RLI4_TRANT|nr:hypothetical protein SAY86_000524 [Trapa natans]KAK4802692.1 hypothetical protein SAY86_000895 [Trapa natans]
MGMAGWTFTFVGTSQGVKRKTKRSGKGSSRYQSTSVATAVDLGGGIIQKSAFHCVGGRCRSTGGGGKRGRSTRWTRVLGGDGGRL